MIKNNFQKGMSLIEILIVIAIFAILGILVTQSVILTLGGSKKSESVVRARENLDYSLGIMERQIRNATSISSCTATAINYFDQDGQAAAFSCTGLGTDNSYIASGSARLTNEDVKITECLFTCSPAVNPSTVAIDLTVKETQSSGVQSAEVSGSTQIYLRNY